MKDETPFRGFLRVSDKGDIYKGSVANYKTNVKGRKRKYKTITKSQIY